jgi:hypothetical protein
MPDVAKVVDFGSVDTGDTAQLILGTPAGLAPEAIVEPRS